jgi:hypothetical protein
VPKFDSIDDLISAFNRTSTTPVKRPVVKRKRDPNPWAERSPHTAYTGYTGPIRAAAPWRPQTTLYRRLKVAQESLTVRQGEPGEPLELSMSEWFDRLVTITGGCEQLATWVHRSWRTSRQKRRTRNSPPSEQLK